MALVKVRWETTEQWEAEVEIDGFEDGETSMDEVLAELEGNGPDDAKFLGCTDRDVLEYTVLRAGDEPLPAEAAKITAPRHEPEWDD